MAHKTARAPYGGNDPTNGTDTSNAAAAFIDDHTLAIRDRILRLLKLEPLADFEIEERLDLKHTTASARRRELVLDALVVDSGERRKTDSGCSAIVWRAVGKDEQLTLDAPSQLEVVRDKLRALVGKLETMEQVDSVWRHARRVLEGEQ